MTRMVNCVKRGVKAEGLDRAPLPGKLGQRVFDTISKEAWQDWMRHQTMLINEHRLSVIEPQARAFLEAELEKFLFGEGSAPPEGYVAPG
ncbi:MAG: oxidative damage protection protein [Gammaproteobacteria bacterium]|nr:oxidative damage protection protein [Gammaproteobacteria bacterium]